MDNVVALVTGASRGLGRGIARALGSKGFTVYITGRSQDELTAAAEEITALGGLGIACVCDHSDNNAVKQVIEKIDSESNRLDILVNNAAAVYAQELSKPGPYWQKPLYLADMIEVGLKSNYVTAYYATPLLIETGGSLMVHISFYGAVCYFHGPAYGASKAGIDKMNFDMAIDLAETDVTSVSLWPGLILSDAIKNLPEEHLTEELKARLEHFESPEFTGHVIERLLRDPQRMSYSG